MFGYVIGMQEYENYTPKAERMLCNWKRSVANGEEVPPLTV